MNTSSEIIRVAKETAYTALKERELQDNAIAGEKGLKPYTLLNVEFNDGADQQSSGYMRRWRWTEKSARIWKQA